MNPSLAGPPNDAHLQTRPGTIGVAHGRSSPRAAPQSAETNPSAASATPRAGVWRAIYAGGRGFRAPAVLAADILASRANRGCPAKISRLPAADRSRQHRVGQWGRHRSPAD